MPISREELEQLFSRNEPDGNVLSVYLDVDQSRTVNLNRRFVGALKERLRWLEQRLQTDRERHEFDADARRVLEFVAASTPRGRTLVVFCDDSRGFFWSRELHIEARNDARWEDGPYVRPLLEALDEYERYLVALVSKEHLRLFSIFLGEIEEQREISAGDRIKRTKAAAKDTRLSADRVQDREDERVYLHQKDFAGHIGRMAGARASDRIILAGRHEVVAELHKLLPKHVQVKVVKQVQLPESASGQDVLKVTLKVEQEIERQEELRLVEELITNASKGLHAVLEWPDTLEALHEGRIRTLVYPESPTSQGARCTNCDSLLAGQPASCPYCGSAVKPVGDLLDRVAERVVEQGGVAEIVRGEAAERLRAAAGIGALLRF